MEPTASTRARCPPSGCPSDFTSISSNANGFVFGTAGDRQPLPDGRDYECRQRRSLTVNQLRPAEPAGPHRYRGRSEQSEFHLRAGGLHRWNSNSGCGNANGCQLGVWASTDGGATWSFMTGSAGGSLRLAAWHRTDRARRGGDYPQNWYDQGIAVDPNNPDRVFIDTFDVWLASRTGTSLYDITCGYSGTPQPRGPRGPARARISCLARPSILLAGNDGGVFATSNANIAAMRQRPDPTWFNMDTGLNTIEFYSGDISGNFATSPTPQAVGGAQDNGPSSVTFAGSPDRSRAVADGSGWRRILRADRSDRHWNEPPLLGGQQQRRPQPLRQQLHGLRRQLGKLARQLDRRHAVVRPADQSLPRRHSGRRRLRAGGNSRWLWPPDRRHDQSLGDDLRGNATVPTSAWYVTTNNPSCTRPNPCLPSRRWATVPSSIRSSIRRSIRASRSSAPTTATSRSASISARA